ncbi:hypothetical protein [Lichenibacterium dinghuense]|uniref:hypothetical protein n=1 Tax=Lichenibacterium dinghuense TaxID=2895977 RepID=UPI001F38D494|nr:hypothetical protein [Lichenibacterium sp. 6Y81]
MTSFKIIGAACALALLSAGGAAAAPMAHQDLTPAASAATAASLTGSSMAGKRKQRQRTRTTRCNNVPSRC